MQAYLVTSDGGPDAIERVERPDPGGDGGPGPGEVLVSMRAASLNFRDTIVAAGGYPRNDSFPCVPLSDGAGVVDAIGEGVTNFAVGDRVVNTFFRDWIAGDPTEQEMRSSYGGGIDGVLAERVLFPERALLPIPEHLSFEEAACLPCAAVTAWQALFVKGDLTAGQSVLCLGTGGVSTIALQLAKAAGATVYITSSSDEKLERAKELGADGTVNYKTTPDWHKEVRKLTDGRGVDHVVEVGGPGTLEKSMRACALNGHIGLIGVLTGTSGAVNPLPCVFERLSIDGIYVGSRQMFAALNRHLSANAIRPVIDRTFGFDEAIDAYKHLQSGSHFGKVVVTIGG
ncbi:zinc-dependent alcohol dehydrogenase family protein [Alienimonas chondri]|uniref:Alcohol dehydrogenase n=1 Tax=Alienimonas chondri TaxID=2681879 RepID=A0ABX1VCF4_9PLAN|nr:NAD(P)-dependent alcohol dehydrogenase [Alienimonas chondri]NNJ25116.1 alcohol dehydrogenase [Alienimonas chondri]